MSYIYLDKLSTSAHLSLPDNAPWRSTLYQTITVPNLSHTNVRSRYSEKPPPFMLPDGSVSSALRSVVASSVSNQSSGSSSLSSSGAGAGGGDKWSRDGSKVPDPLDMTVRDKAKRRAKARLVQKRSIAIIKEKAERTERRRQAAATMSKDSGDGAFYDDDDEGGGGGGNVSGVYYEDDENGGDLDQAGGDFEEPNLSSTQLTAMASVIGKSKNKQKSERLKKPYSNSSLFNALLESQCGFEDRWDLSAVEKKDR